MDPIALALPVFVVAILGEALWARRVGRDVIDFDDAVAALATGILQRAWLLLLAAPLALPYAALWEHRLIELPLWLEWVVGIVGVDLCFYAWHRWSHVSHLGWATHLVHHQSERYNLAVSLRQSATEPLSSLPFYLPLALGGVSLEVLVAAGSINLLYQFVQHTELADGPAWWGTVFVTPSHHRVHHAVNPAYLDKNFGGMFILFDRAFGTFAPEEERPKYGTVAFAQTYDPIWANAFWFAKMAEIARASSGWNRWLVPWRSPSWGTQADSAERPPFRPNGGRGHEAYVTFQLGAAVVLLGAAMALVPAPIAATGVAVSLTMAGVVWGRIFERRPWRALEGIRLATNAAAWWLLAGPAAGSVALLWAAASGAWVAQGAKLGSSQGVTRSP